jgi:hypothetical protein
VSDEERGDLYLRFDSEAEATGALFDDDGAARYDMAIDIIGVIYEPTGVILQGPEGPYSEVAPVDGWHANTRGEVPAALAPFVIEVSTPVRVWA